MNQPGYPPPSQPRQNPNSNPYDPWGETRPAPPVYYQPQPPPPVYYQPRRPVQRRTGCCSVLSCLPWVLALLFFGVILGVYLLAPTRTNILLLGVDYAPGKSSVSRSDTIILTTIIPLKPYVGMLSIPRDLWVNIPGVGENRINTAHFFAESQQSGSGPYATMQTIKDNFGVDVKYYVRIRFEGFKDVVDALGGIDVNLPEPMAGYPAGRHHLTGNKALAFARNRTGTDDFFRMEHGQLLLKSIFTQMLNPLKLWRLPGVLKAAAQVTDTNLPVWQWPRLGFAVLRAGPDGIDNRTIRREMVNPFTTSAGANVLLPNWDLINPVLLEMFGQ
jgi:polyisoprenyl-teichoic acid--peptidoglycan teichoic acid transferase